MPVAAPLIIGAATIGGGALAAGAAKSAANTAANAQTAMNDKAIAVQRGQYDQTRSDLMPWQDAGRAALAGQGDLVGLNGANPQQASINNLKQSPLYQSLFGNGQELLTANASATGGLRGGNTQRSLADFGRDTLAQTIQQQIANFGSISQQGQQAATSTGQFGANAANQISGLDQNSGSAQAGAANAVGAANIGFIKDALGAFTGAAGNKDVQNWVGKLF